MTALVDEQDPSVDGRGGPVTNYFTTYLGLVPPGAAAEGVWKQMASVQQQIQHSGNYFFFPNGKDRNVTIQKFEAFPQ